MEVKPKAPMELDLDSFLQLQSSDEEEDDPIRGYNPTLDDILNDSDNSLSSSLSSSSLSGSIKPVESQILNLQSHTLESLNSQSSAAETLNSQFSVIETPKSRLELDDPTISNSSLNHSLLGSKLDCIRRRAASRESIGRSPSFDSNLSLLNRKNPNSSLPRLFGGIKPSPKPGAALAAAAAASRTVPTPHATAIKFRKARGALQKMLIREDSNSSLNEYDETGSEHISENNQGDGFSSVGSEQSASVSGEKVEDLDTKEVGIGGDSEVVDRKEVISFREEEFGVPSVVESIEADSVLNRKVLNGDELEQNKSTNEENCFEVVQKDQVEEFEDLGLTVVESSVTVKQEFRVTENPTEIVENTINKTAETNDSGESSINAAVRTKDLEMGGSLSDETEETKLVEETVDVNQRKLLSENEVAEDRSIHHESKRSGKRAGKKLRSAMKPLDLAEEMEKKNAFSGLHWEEGAAAQPMRLEGIRRGPPAVGYLQIDPDNAISHAILSYGFRRDHGSPQALAVHMNYIAVGMSKGVVLVMPSRYSAHSSDNMDSKVFMLGSPGEKSHPPITAMCFNLQGDLLLVGYGNANITVWDVQKGASVKVLTGEHTAPIVHLFFQGQDSQVTRQFRVISGDCKGLVLLHTFAVVPLLNRFSVKTQCLFDGQKTGTVLSASPLLFEDIQVGRMASIQGGSMVSSSGLGSMVGGVVGGVVGGDSGWKLFNDGSSIEEEGVVIFVNHHTALVVKLGPSSVEAYERLSRPDGVREGSLPYTAWKCATNLRDVSTEGLDRASLIAIAWDRKVQVATLRKAELKINNEWSLDSAAIGVSWLDDRMLVVLTLKGQLCLFTKEGNEIHRTSFIQGASGGDDVIVYHTLFTNSFGNPEKAYHNSIAVRGASIYILGPSHLLISRLLPWKERIQVLRRAGDWMGALDMALRLYDGHAHGVIDLPRTLDSIRVTIMPYLIELVTGYVDEVFSYISVAFHNRIDKQDQNGQDGSRSFHLEIKEQFARVGGVAVEFCVHISRIDILFDEIFSKFVAVQQGGTFLELLEPYILKDMLGCLPPEIMQALVEHYSSKGWLQRVEQCVLHMDISSLDFNQVVRLCREHGLYSALIYLFNRGLDDFKAPLEELLVVAQDSQNVNAVAIGYRMLVYLKYCFLGLAFPPGRGSIIPSRLLSLKKEMMQFLLQSSNTSEIVTNSTVTSGPCLNICYFLWLDTEATLEVLKFAFQEEENLKGGDYLNDLVNTDIKASMISGSENVEGENSLVQNTLNTLVQVLDMELTGVVRSSGSDDGSLKVWPSKKDVGLLLEFIACFVACHHAVVPKSLLNRILEYLTCDNDVSPWDSDSKPEIARRREKMVLALLKVVAETEWDSLYVLELCEKAQFYQVCSLIHIKRAHYVAALDSYMKEIDEPIHAFAFISNTLLQMRDNDSSDFRQAVVTRIPELVKLSREGAFFFIIEHFSKESDQILFQLRSHPRSLFLYLKTVIDVHLSGSLNVSALRKGHVLDPPLGLKTVSDHSKDIEAYLERVSNLPKMLRQNSVQVTDEMAELYLELLCQYEPHSVLKFLETFENYRVEHCLRLCQEHGVIDAAAFLLERVGDVGSALSLALSGIDEKISMIHIAVGNKVAEAGSTKFTELEWLNIVLEMKEVNVVHDVLLAAVGLCQRNTLRLDFQESETLWFLLLDITVRISRAISDTPAASLGVQAGDRSYRWHDAEFDKVANVYRRLLSRFIGEIVEGMVGYVPLLTIMAKLLSDNGFQEFGDFKVTIMGMLATYGYERRILDAAKALIEDDTFYSMSLLKKGASHAYTPLSTNCCICNCSLTKDSAVMAIRVFHCGHVAHVHCDIQETNTLSKDSSVGCPVCMPNVKPSSVRGKGTLMENGFVSTSYAEPQHSQGMILQPLHESDVIEKPYGLQHMSRFEILGNLQNTLKSLKIDPLPQLRLSPPAIYHDKVKKNTGNSKGGSTSSSRKGEKSNKNQRAGELTIRGTSSFQFPLKSNIFSSEKRKKRTVT
ncbi:uncharacterized protein LOC18428491 isoform X2 [Amborella trichopoda]|uniref:uncharacterized protein LOC18428491 isoform X2 n=1 Tax=Amborella trichopoda TaxID=13333 RepID=UPI0009BF6376|nr:uncharacterized protein LOC18428491 isoform X2 [Amborella trichopoda]|eukprot:XP_020519433.1 uncharacterized protein LOC18428491 isoform X2 [Amborella trichopoda]